MLPKTPIIIYLILLFSGAVCVSCAKSTKAPTTNQSDELPVAQTPKDESPHNQALSLIFRTQQQKIAELDAQALDKEDWWFDTKKRNWTVQRPFGPGGIDSTHWFDVIYKIDDKIAGMWQVDTEKKEVRWTLTK